MWAYGKIEPGWYCARWLWNETYAQHLQSLGYKVQQSLAKPKGAQMTIEEVYGTMEIK